MDEDKGGDEKIGGWHVNKQWADGYLPQIQRVIREVAPQLITIRVSTRSEDVHQASDYVVVTEQGSIGCRVRRPHTWERYGDVTFRSKVRGTRKTEIDKILEGWGRWYLYAWALDNTSTDLEAWVFLDLDQLRASGLLLKKMREIDNYDSSSKFKRINIPDLQRGNCILDAGGAALGKIK